jgi:Predicted nucleic acid-binding protein, contains PIN domain
MSMPSWISPSMAEPTRGLLDTSVLIDHGQLDPAGLPDEAAVSAISVAELAAGPHTTRDRAERARRQDRLQWVSATFEPLPFDVESARAYGRVVSAVRAAGRKERRRMADLLIAATAASNGLPLYTRNPSDFDGLAGLVEVRSV